MLTHVNTTVLWRYKIKSNLESIPFWVPYKSKKVMLQVGTRYYWLEKNFYHLYFNPKISNFGSNCDSIGLKKKSQNYSTWPDSTLKSSVDSWLEDVPTRPTPKSKQKRRFFANFSAPNKLSWLLLCVKINVRL